MLRVISYRLAALSCRSLPQPLPRTLAWLVAEVNWRCMRRTRRVVVDNLVTVHNGEVSTREARCRARRVFHNFARATQMFLSVEHMSPAEFDRLCDLEGFQAALKPLGPNPRFVLASAHLGPWELGGYAMARCGLKVNTVARDDPSPGVAKFVQNLRSSMGVRAYPVAGAFVRLRAALDRGESVALLVDRTYGGRGRSAVVFGVATELPWGHLALAVRTGVPVITGALVFDGGRRLRYVHGGTQYPSRVLTESEAVEDLERRCVRDLEGLIRANSDQWCQFEPLRRSGTI